MTMGVVGLYVAKEGKVGSSEKMQMYVKSKE